MDIEMKSRISGEEPFVKVTDCQGNPIEVKTVEVDSSGNVSGVVDIKGNHLNPCEIIVNKNLLYIPGIGYVEPETLVVIRGVTYRLKFGWHTNISNQVLYSWFLVSRTSSLPKTVYASTLNEIEEIRFE